MSIQVFSNVGHVILSRFLQMPWNLGPTWNILIPRQVARLESGYLGIWHGLGLPGWLVLVAQWIDSSAEKMFRVVLGL